MAGLLRFPSPVPPPTARPSWAWLTAMSGAVTGLPEGKGLSLGRESGDLGSSWLGWSQEVVPAEVAFWESLNLEGRGSVNTRGWFPHSLLHGSLSGVALRGGPLGIAL